MPKIKVELTDVEASEELYVGKEKNQDMVIRDPKHPGVVRCYDPATGCLLGEMKAMTPAEVDASVLLAVEAQKKWRKTTWEQRRQVLRIMMQYIVENQERICKVDARDSGKPMVDALLGEIMTTCEKISYVVKHGESVLAREYRPTR